MEIGLFPATRMDYLSARIFIFQDTDVIDVKFEVFTLV
jgi:hypothetical protein